jgi:hypothetical protein
VTGATLLQCEKFTLERNMTHDRSFSHFKILADIFFTSTQSCDFGARVGAITGFYLGASSADRAAARLGMDALGQVGA